MLWFNFVLGLNFYKNQFISLKTGFIFINCTKKDFFWGGGGVVEITGPWFFGESKK